MNRKKDNNLSFRVSDETTEKLNTILDAQNKLFEKMGVSKMTKTLLLEKLIHDEYINYLNKDKDPETTDRINRMIDTRLELAIRNRDKYLQEILFESRKTNALLNLLIEKQGMNVHNTEVVESIENKSELEAVVDRLIAKKVFGEAKNKEEKVKQKLNKETKSDEYKTKEIEAKSEQQIDDEYHEDIVLSSEEIKQIMSNFYEHEEQNEQTQEISDEEIKAIMRDYFKVEDSDE